MPARQWWYTFVTSFSFFTPFQQLNNNNLMDWQRQWCQQPNQQQHEQQEPHSRRERHNVEIKEPHSMPTIGENSKRATQTIYIERERKTDKNGSTNSNICTLAHDKRLVKWSNQPCANEPSNETWLYHRDRLIERRRQQRLTWQTNSPKKKYSVSLAETCPWFESIYSYFHSAIREKKTFKNVTWDASLITVSHEFVLR